MEALNQDQSLIAPSYEAWNQALARYFYNPHFAGRPVYLQVDSDSLRDIATYVGIEPDQAEEAFVHAVRSRLKHGHGNPFAEFTREVWRWRRHIRDAPATPPRFLGLLGICVLAASRMCTDPRRGVISSNYYVWLNELLGLKHHGMPPYFEIVTGLWSELNTWLEETNDGSIGLPTAKTHSWFVNVGYPISQCLLRNVDRQKLPDFFRWEGLDPNEDISGEDLIPRLRLWATRTTCTLSEHGKRVFTSNDNRLIRQAADVIAAELRLWDGGSIDTEGRRYATIELRLDVHRGGRKFTCELYPRAPEGFPEGTYQVGHRHIDLKALPGMPWFEPLPAAFLEETLAHGLLLRRDVYALQHKESPVIPLGNHVELGGWVSCGRVNLGERYLVLCRGDYQEKIKEYLHEYAASSWQQAPGTAGLPASWICFQNVQIVAFAEEYPEDLDCLVPRLRVGIHLQGGLKVETNVWLQGGEPDAVITTQEDERVSVLIDGLQVDVLSTGSGVLELASLNLQPGDHEIVAGTQRRRFHLCASGYCPIRASETESLGYVLRQDGALYYPIALGPTCFTLPRSQQNEQVTVVGARVIGIPESSPVSLQEELVLPHGYKRYIVLGRRPGEVVEYHIDSEWPYWYLKKYGHLKSDFRVPVPFEPQWVVKVGRKRRKHLSPIGIPASPEAVIADPSLVDEWARWTSKQYHNMKKQSRYEGIWEEYRDLAKTIGGKRTWTTTPS